MSINHSNSLSAEFLPGMAADNAGRGSANPSGTHSHLNLKWSVADADRVLAQVAKGRSAVEICRDLKGTSLASKPDEILRLGHDAGVYIRRRPLIRGAGCR